MAKLRGSKSIELNAIAETLRLVLETYVTEQDLIDAINAVIRTAEAWAANGKPTPNRDMPPLLHKADVGGSGSVQKRYRCLLCGRDKFTRKSPHYCVGGYRKHGLQWAEVE